jgi:hypothetical protein
VDWEFFWGAFGAVALEHSDAIMREALGQGLHCLAIHRPEAIDVKYLNG